jgi:chromosome segregation ATPase
MRAMFAALALSVVAASGMGSSAHACGMKPKAHIGCAQHTESKAAQANREAAEIIAWANKQADELIGRAKQELQSAQTIKQNAIAEADGLKAHAAQEIADARALAQREIADARAETQRDIADDKAAADRDIANRKREAATSNAEATTLRRAAAELQEFLVVKTEEQKKAQAAADERKGEAERAKQDSLAAIKDANDRKRAAEEEIKVTQDQRRKHAQRFIELLDQDPCGPAGKKAPAPGT